MKSKSSILILAIVILCSSLAMGEDTILFHGLYQKERNEKGNYGYLRFYEDGTVLGVLTSPEQVDEMAQSFTKDQPNPIGQYTTDGSRIKFTTMLKTYGVTHASWDHEGEIKGETLIIETTYKGIKSKGVYKFIPFAKPVGTQLERSIKENQKYEVIQPFESSLKDQGGGHPKQYIKMIRPGDILMDTGEQATVKVVYRQTTPGINVVTTQYEDIKVYYFKIIHVIDRKNMEDKKNDRIHWSDPEENQIVKLLERHLKECIVPQK